MISHAMTRWLEDFQADFSRVLRTPLDRSTGHLRAAVDQYASHLVTSIAQLGQSDALSGLATYNRQYWLRLFTVMQGEFPLVARLMGYWHFNKLAEHYLTAQPPTRMELHLVGAYFPEFIAGLGANCDPKSELIPSGLTTTLLSEAAHLDLAWSEVFLAPEEPMWQPSAADAASLMDLQLQPASRWTVLRQNWPLVQLRHHLIQCSDEKAIRAPSQLPSPEWWLLRQVDKGMEQVQLPEWQAALYDLITKHPLGEALARYESLSASAATATTAVTGWLEQSMHWGLWAAASRY